MVTISQDAAITAQSLADMCLATLKRAVDDPRVVCDVQQQLQRMPHAVLPLVSLGSEWDTPALWDVTCSLDSRFASMSFDADDPEAVHMLETALDSVSVEIIDLVLEPAQQLLPGVSLSRGLIDSQWAIYAVISRELVLPRFDQLALW